MNKFFIGLAVILLLLGGVFYFFNLYQNPTPETATESDQIATSSNPNKPEEAGEIEVPQSFRLHAEPELHYTIQIPLEVDVSKTQENFTRYRYVGPNSKPDTEITDGYTVSITVEETEIISVSELKTEKVPEDSQNLKESSISFSGKPAVQYEVESVIGTNIITHYLILGENGFLYDIGIYTSGDITNNYKKTVQKIIESISFLNESESSAIKGRLVPIAMLDYDSVSKDYIRSSNGFERGCDQVIIINHVLNEPTSQPLNASLNQLFAYDSEIVGGWQNFIASRKDTLAFDRAELKGRTAHIYLTGDLGTLGGVCDNPRAAIQIEETALAYDTVDEVRLYLNEEVTSLIPSGRE